MKNREYYEEELKTLESVITTPEEIRRVEQEIKTLEDKQAQSKKDKEDGTRGTGLNNSEKHQLKELRSLRKRMERKEELEVLLNMNGIEEFTQEAEGDRAQEETLEMIDEMVSSNAERAANEAKGARTEKGKTFRGHIPQREGYYQVAVPTQLTQRGEVRARKDEMSKNSLLGASMQLATLAALAKRTDLTPKQQSMIEKLTRYFNKVLETLKEEDRLFAEQMQAREEPEQETIAPEVGADDELERSSGAEEEIEPEVKEEPEAEEEIDYDNLTEQQKREFQIRGTRANLENVIAKLKELEALKEQAIKRLEEAQAANDQEAFIKAEQEISSINMKKMPLQNQARELTQRLNELEGRGGPEEAQQPRTNETPAQEERPEGEAQVGATAPGVTQDEREEASQEPLPENKENEQEREVVETVSGWKALVELFIRIIQKISGNPELLEGTRQNLVTVKSLPKNLDPRMTTVPEGTMTKEQVQILAEEAKKREEQTRKQEEAEQDRQTDAATIEPPTPDEKPKAWEEGITDETRESVVRTGQEFASRETAERENPDKTQNQTREDGSGMEL